MPVAEGSVSKATPRSEPRLFFRRRDDQNTFQHALDPPAKRFSDISDNDWHTYA
jgi:hypothetical protein